MSYVCPVPGGARVHPGRHQGPDRRQQPAGLPDARQADKLSHGYYIYRDYDEYQAWNDVFNPIIES